MSWKNVVGTVILVTAIGAVARLGAQESKSHSPEAYDAQVAAQFKAYNARLPEKVEGDGEAVTALAARLDGRTVTFDFRYDEPQDWLDDKSPATWDSVRAGLVAYYCTDKSLRLMLNRNYALSIRIHDHKSVFKKQVPTITVADCPNAS